MFPSKVMVLKVSKKVHYFEFCADPSKKSQSIKAIYIYASQRSQNSYFPSSIKEWNRLDIDIRKSDSISIFKKRILYSIRPLPNKVSNSHNPQGLKLLTRLRLGLSHLRCHKFKHNFLDTINPLCSCGSDIETALHFLLYCPNLCNAETPF